MIELLSPVGDFDCLKAAVQNGANAVYFAAKSFGARAFASNFDDDTLKQAIEYAKLRNVKTNLTLNTLIKENEFEDAFNLAKKAYKYGIDAIIIQDIGLATKLHQEIPDLVLHASTQMTIHNLEGVNYLKSLGFKRVVLSRELSLEEIEYICKNADIEIEVFIHGALCISYSGQCLFSSMLGGRSGNRGKCAQTCRLPYELIEESYKNQVVLNADNTSSIREENTQKRIDKGYLLSTRDLYSLEYLPQLIKSGVTSFKIEGRMKNPEYVATVTRIYRKYIDLILSNLQDSSNYIIDKQDLTDLMQVFNRGGFSSGHLNSKENRNLVFKEKQNNMGISLGTITKYNKNKGHITCKLTSPISVGDSISFEKENTKYTISELMIKNTNIKNAQPQEIVTFGRMKGNINVNDKIYKISDKELTKNALDSFSTENIKNQLNCKLDIKLNEPIKVEITCPNFSKTISYTFNYNPEVSKTSSLSEEKIIEQFRKTQDTCFEFKNFEINLDDNLFMPVSVLNNIRRQGIELIQNKILNSFKRTVSYNSDNRTNSKHSGKSANVPSDDITLELSNYSKNKTSNFSDLVENPKVFKISLLLNNLNLDFDYTKLEHIDKLYIPLKYFGIQNYFELLSYITNKFNVYIYLPTIIRKNYTSTVKNIITQNIEKLNIKGFVISNISEIELLKEILDINKFELVGNYTLNVYSTNSLESLQNMELSCATFSPELDKEALLDALNKFQNTSTSDLLQDTLESTYIDFQNITPNDINTSYNILQYKNNISTELIVYGNIPVMTINYCPLGKSNKCYKECTRKCSSKNAYYLKDRMGINFRIIPDNTQTITTIYNSKITSIDFSDFNINFARIDILNENIDEINFIIDTVKNKKRLEGKDYTNGNLNRII